MGKPLLFVAVRPRVRPLDELVLDALDHFSPAAVTSTEIAARVFSDPEPGPIQIKEVEAVLCRLVDARAAGIAQLDEDQRIWRAQKLGASPWAVAMGGGLPT